MQKLYIITGADGHLASTIIQLLKKQDVLVRGLILPNQTASSHGNVTYIKGDITKKETLIPLFENCQEYETIVIHTAGIISIANEVSPPIYQVNVEGTKNLIELSLSYPISRFLYTSSVHAIPEKKNLYVIQETSHFDPSLVKGAYAKTKAQATQLVLDSVKDGLPAIVVHPSGIIGPFGNTSNHLVQLILDYAHGRLPACVKGGYDFVDVRDVAKGCLLAIEKGNIGQCYILSNRHYTIEEILFIIRSIQGGRKVPTLPTWVAKIALPFLEQYAKWRNRRPLYTKYSLYTLTSNDKFSHQKASQELGYEPRDLYESIQDTLNWDNHRNVSII